MIFDSSSFTLFHSGQVFHELVCSLTVVVPQIVYYLIHCSPIQFSFAFFGTSWCCYSLLCTSHILQVKLFLSQVSPSDAQIKTIKNK